MLNIFRDRLFYRTKLDRIAARYRSDKASGYLAEFGYTHGYTRVYESLFEPRRHNEVNLLEIGLLRPDTAGSKQSDDKISSAPSLEIWREYFPAAQLYGFDIRAYCGKPMPRCEILQGDQGRTEDLDRLIEACPEGFDIIIDDGSHASQHQQITFGTLFPHLRPGGIYIIEDLHWQPSDIEDPSYPHTVEIFQHYAVLKTLTSPAWSQEAGAVLAQKIRSVQFFDSLEALPQKATDALMVVRAR